MSYTHYYKLSILLRVSANNFSIFRESKHTVENLLQIQQITTAIITACNILQVAYKFKVTDIHRQKYKKHNNYTYIVFIFRLDYKQKPCNMVQNSIFSMSPSHSCFLIQTSAVALDPAGMMSLYY